MLAARFSEEDIDLLLAIVQSTSQQFPCAFFCDVLLLLGLRVIVGLMSDVSDRHSTSHGRSGRTERCTGMNAFLS